MTSSWDRSRGQPSTGDRQGRGGNGQGELASGHRDAAEGAGARAWAARAPVKNRTSPITAAIPSGRTPGVQPGAGHRGGQGAEFEVAAQRRRLWVVTGLARGALSDKGLFRSAGTVLAAACREVPAGKRGKQTERAWTHGPSTTRESQCGQ